jgi:hypothetical protein
VLREENAGLCDPESCSEYQAKKCNLTGRFIFFIPGIKSISAFDLQTNSFYAMQAAIEKFTTIGFMRGGRISGFLDGQRTPFYISKRLVEVSRIDDEGRPSRVAQWLIELEAPVDVTSLLRPDDGLEALEMRAGEAAAMLEGGHADVRGAGRADDGVIDIVASRAADAPDAPVQETRRDAARAEAAASAGQPAPTGGGATEMSREGSGRASPRAAGSNDDLKWIFDAAAALGVEQERFEAYADKRWGKGWKLAAGGRKRALDEVTGFADDAAGFQEKVRGELDVFS